MQCDLKTARDKKDWTQTQLAERSGIDEATISRIEAGITANPSNATVTALEQALKLRRGTLVFGDQVKELAP